MTLNTYTHALDEQKRGNMKKLNDVFIRDKGEKTIESQIAIKLLQSDKYNIRNVL